LKKLEQHALDIKEHGDLSARLPLKRKDEIGKLAEEFDRMVAEIEEYTEALEDKNSQLKSDILRREKAEAEKEDLEKQLIQVKKMEALGTMAGGVSHDFNNILAIISLGAELALLDTPEHSLARRNLESILDTCQRGKAITWQILHFTRMSERETRAVSLASLVEEALAHLRPGIASNIQVRFSCTADRDTILVDPQQMIQVLLNLFNNAVFSMKEKGGILEIEIQNAKHAGLNPERTKSVVSGPYVQINVRDTGCGIAPENLEKLFDPYFTTKDVGEGSGLGLAVVHGVVSKYGGYIEVESLPGKGSVFKVYFPVSEETA